MKTIETTPIITLRDGYHIDRVNAPGTIQTGIDKNGPIIASYDAASLFLVDPKGVAVVGPIVVAAAVDLAQSVCTGNARALTEPQAIHVLATTLLALFSIIPGAAAPVEMATQKAQVTA
jgi:hypothetical protein